MNGQDRVGVALGPAVVDDLLGATLDLGVAALHRVKVEVGGVLAGGHGARGATAHADLHARAAELDQQRTRGEWDFVGLTSVDHAQTTRDHDRLVVAHGLTGHGLFVFAEIAQEVGTAEFVVERRATQGAFGHDLQRAGDVRGLAVGLVGQAAPQARDSEAGQARFGFGAATGGAFVADFTARARGRAGVWRNGGGVVVGFHLHQHMVHRAFFDVRCAAALAARNPALDRVAGHDGRVVRIRHHRVLWAGLVGVADHAKEAVVLRLTVDGELGVEDFVAAVFAVGLREHHQLHIGGVALQAHKGGVQVVDFVVGQGQTPIAVGPQQGLAATAEHIHIGHRSGLQFGEQGLGLAALAQHVLGHAVVQDGGDGLPLRVRQRRTAEPARAALHAVLDQTLHPFDRQAAVVCDVGGLRSPGRNGAQTRHHQPLTDHVFGRVRRRHGLAVGQQLAQPRHQSLVGDLGETRQVHKTGADAGDVGVNRRQTRQPLLDFEVADGVAAVKKAQVQGHGGGLGER